MDRGVRERLLELEQTFRSCAQNVYDDNGAFNAYDECAEAVRDLADALTGQEGAAPSPRAEGSTDKELLADIRRCASFTASETGDDELENAAIRVMIACDGGLPALLKSAEGTEPAAQREGAAQPECAHGHKRRVTGCCSCVIVFDWSREGAAQEPPPQAEERER